VLKHHTMLYHHDQRFVNWFAFTIWLSIAGHALSEHMRAGNGLSAEKVISLFEFTSLYAKHLSGTVGEVSCDPHFVNHVHSPSPGSSLWQTWPQCFTFTLTLATMFTVLHPHFVSHVHSPSPASSLWQTWPQCFTLTLALTLHWYTKLYFDDATIYFIERYI
jgi:hypothetical protein